MNYPNISQIIFQPDRQFKWRNTVPCHLTLQKVPGGIPGRNFGP